MIARIVILALLALVASCSSRPPDEPPATPAAGAPTGIVVPKPAADAPLLDAASLRLIVDGETGGPARYTRLYLAPVWPGGGSGVTIGIGYDLGQSAADVIRLDWDAHRDVERLVAQAGIAGAAARARIPTLRDVVTAWPLAEGVFTISTLPRYYRLADRAFGNGFRALAPPAQGALVSLVYNRGAAMAGERRREMRTIRDECVPRGDRHCIARELRAMVRVWAGTDIEAGMRARREAEARLAEGS